MTRVGHVSLTFEEGHRSQWNLQEEQTEGVKMYCVHTLNIYFIINYTRERKTPLTRTHLVNV